MKDEKLIGYKAMYEFLQEYYNRGKSDEIAILLGSLSLLKDGTTADPAYINDWEKAYKKALDSSEEDYLLKLDN